MAESEFKQNQQGAENQVEEGGSSQNTEGESLSNTIKAFSAGEDVDLEAINDVPIDIKVVLGEAEITVEELLKMGKGAIISLDKKIGEPVELFVNNRCVAKGEIVVVEDKIGITMTEVLRKEKE